MNYDTEIDDLDRIPDSLDSLDSGVCVVRAGYEGMRRSSNISDVSSILSTPIHSTESVKPVQKFDEIDSIAKTMDSMSLNEEQNKLNKTALSKAVLNKTVLTRDLILDFSNVEPDRYVITKGGGIIITVMGERFVLTCSHIMMRSGTWFRAYFKIDDSVEIFDLNVHTRIPELDMIIMRFSQPEDRYAMYDPRATADAVGHKSRLRLIRDIVSISNFQMIRDYRITVSNIMRGDMRGDDTDDVPEISNVIVSPSNNPDAGEFQVKHIEIGQYQTIYSNLVTNLIDSVPIISIPLESMYGVIKLNEIEEKYGKKIKDAVDYQNKRSIDYVIMNQVHKLLAGLSGSIIYSKLKSRDRYGTSIPIGQIVTFNIGLTNVDGEEPRVVAEIRAVPLDVMLNVVDNCLRRRSDKIMGIQVSYTGCIAEEDGGDEFDAAIINENSSRYVNGRKDFWFNKSDLIIKIDQIPLERDGSDLIIDAEQYGRVPINGYFFYKANTNPGTEIGVMIPKLYEDAHKKINFNIMPTPYSDMFRIRPFHQKEILWKGYIFLEVSEELLRFYSEIGIDLRMFENDEEMYRTSANGERVVIIFNYDRCFDELGDSKRFVPSTTNIMRRYLSLNEYRAMPCTAVEDGHRYFYELEKVSNRSVNHIDELDRIIDQIDKVGQKKITLLLRNRLTDESVRMNI
jgi:hypothetical protein